MISSPTPTADSANLIDGSIASMNHGPIVRPKPMRKSTTNMATLYLSFLNRFRCLLSPALQGAGSCLNSNARVLAPHPDEQLARRVVRDEFHPAALRDERRVLVHAAGDL